MEKKKKFLSLAVAAFAACLIALGAMLCVPAVASAEEPATVVDYVFGPTDGHKDSLTVETVASGGTSWHIVVNKENHNETNDLTKYEGIAFDIVTTTAQNSTLNVIFRADNGKPTQKDYRAYGNNTAGVYIKKTGEHKTHVDLGLNGCNIIPSGFSGTIVLPWGVFQNGSAGNWVFASSGVATYVKILFAIEQNTFSGNSTITISNVRAVVDPEATAKIVSVDNSLTHITETEITASNYSSLKKLFEDATATYQSLSDTNKAKITDAETRFATVKSKFDEYAARAVQQMIDALPDEITAENYEEAKTALNNAQTAFDGLTDEQKANVTNSSKLNDTAALISNYEVQVVVAKIDALPGEITAENYEAAVAALNNAQTAFDGLTDEQKANVNNSEKINTTKGLISDYEADDVQAKIEALVTEIIAENYVTAKRNYVSVRNEYEALTDEQKARITNDSKFDEVKAAIEAFESTKADEIALIDANTGNSGFDLTIGTEDIWALLGLANGDQTMDLSFSRGFAFDIETDSEVKAGLTVYFRENGDKNIEFGGYGNKTFGMYVYPDGTCKTNRALGIGANNIPAGFKGTIFLPWEAFEKGNEYASPEKAANVKLLLFIDKTFGEGKKLKLSNFRLSNGIVTSATVLSIDKSLTYLTDTEMSAENYLDLKNKFAATKATYKSLNSSYYVKINNAESRFAAIETKFNEGSASIVQQMINALSYTEINAENYEAAKTALKNAQTAYNGLTAEQKKEVTNSTNIDDTAALISNYEVQVVVAKIVALSYTEINAENYEAAKTALKNAQTAYNGLTAEQKAEVTTDKLDGTADLIARYEKVVAIDKSLTYLTDTEMSANNYLDLKGKFAETKAKYDSLTDTDKAKITDAESRFAAIETKFNDGSASIVQQMINELPDEIAAENYEEAKAALKDAQSAYDGLTAEQKEGVTTDKLDSTTRSISDYEVQVVVAKIDALVTEITAENYVTAKRNYVSVRNEYEALTDEQKESVTNSVKLDEVKATIGAFESTKADEIALVDGETGSSGFDLTIGIEAIWKRLGLAGGDQTMDLSFSKGFAFDIETNSDVNAGLTVYFRENGESAKQYGGYGNKTFGMYVYSDGTCKTNSALGIGANLIPAGFKGTIFLPWEAFEKGKEYASPEKAANVKLLLFIDKTFGIGTTLKISNFRLSNGISTSATVLSVDRTFGYIDGEAISDGNYAALNSRFVAAKGNYDALTAENKAKVTNADKIGSIEEKLETYRLGYAIAKIDACLTEVNADNCETAKTLLGEAKKAYGALTEASKERVTNAATIATAIAAIETYEASLTDAKFEALPETVNSGNIEEAKLALEEAKAEYDGLDDGVKSKVTKSDKIAVLEEKIDVYEAGKVDALIAALTDKIDKDNYKLAKKDYIAAQKAYGNLSANGKTKVANAAKFAVVKAAIEKYENTDQVNVAAIILIAAGAVIAIGGAVTFVLIKSKTKKRG